MTEADFWARVDRRGPDECWLWMRGRTGSRRGLDGVIPGYGAFGRPQVKAHRFAWQLANGEIPDGLWVLHRCDNPPCVNPAHLFLGDVQANVDDMRAKGRARYISAYQPATGDHVPYDRRARGEASGPAKLTAAQVIEIRRRRLAGESRRALAREFGICDSNVRWIAMGRTWAHLIDPALSTAA